MNQDLGKWFWRKNRSIQTVQKHLSPFVRAFTWAWVGLLDNPFFQIIFFLGRLSHCHINLSQLGP